MKKRLIKKMGSINMPPMMLYNAELYNNLYSYVPFLTIKQETPLIKFTDGFRFILYNSVGPYIGL